MYPITLRILGFLLVTVLLQQVCISQTQPACAPSSCGKISNISYPFRLTQDPPNCGKPSHELACENNITVLFLYTLPFDQSYLVKLYVESINYNNYTIRLVDWGVQQTECSSIPHYSISQYRSSYTANGEVAYVFANSSQYVILLNCSNRVNDSDYPEYVDTASCNNWNSNGHIYAVVGHLSAQRLNVDCRVMAVAATSLWGTRNYSESFSYTDIHRALLFGFEVMWIEDFRPETKIGFGLAGIMFSQAMK
ncbi:hypothetical protein L6164_002669 [Bauhinia variegata]|uniref:Uncharacterized protein n=1 Tax=Bauhinia variegata TaxID=167791 RepID=A0ACB9Q0E0_BAUVA|nr:hypothetical protein L6164_002669 [Bauhinia variegata]